MTSLEDHSHENLSYFVQQGLQRFHWHQATNCPQLGIKWDKLVMGGGLVRGWLSALPWMGGGKDREYALQLPHSQACFILLSMRGLGQTLSVRSQELSPFWIDSGTVKTRGKGMNYKQKLYRIIWSNTSILRAWKKQAEQSVSCAFQYEALWVTLLTCWRWSKMLLKKAEERRRREAKQSWHHVCWEVRDAPLILWSYAKQGQAGLWGAQ